MKNISDFKYKKKEAWDFAFGLIKVDDLTPSLFLKELAKMNVDGKITTNEILDLLIRKYKASDVI